MNNDPWNIEAIQPSSKPEWLTEAIERELINHKYPINTDGMIMLWDYWKRNLADAKEVEMNYRKICANFLAPAKTEGTTTVELGNDYKAKVVNKFNYKLASDNEVVWAVLDKIGKIGNQGKFIADRLVSWHPTFLKEEYTTLQEEAEKGSEEAKTILKIIETEMLTITDAAPTLTIVEPKAKRK
jgi:hypothetical protein